VNPTLGPLHEAVLVKVFYVRVSKDVARFTTYSFARVTLGE
jgi:hypothetical protein